MTKAINILKLAAPIHDGDWHDAPLKWQVAGPGDERQNFATKKNAMLYAKIRRGAKDFVEASRIYANTDI